MVIVWFPLKVSRVEGTVRGRDARRTELLRSRSVRNSRLVRTRPQERPSRVDCDCVFDDGPAVNYLTLNGH